MKNETTYSKDELQRIVDEVGYWFHSIDVGHGAVTRGTKSPEWIENEIRGFHFPDLQGKTVLDIGAFDGAFSFEMERRGAQVTALDHYVWSLDLPSHIKYWSECREKGIVPQRYDLTPDWQPDTLPGKRAFDTAHLILNSNVRSVVADFMEMDLAELGQFDVVLYTGVLYHMEDPLRALKRVAQVTRDLAIVSTNAVFVPGYEDIEMCTFYSANQLNNDVSNWWGINFAALTGMCHAAGFRTVETIEGPPSEVVSAAEVVPTAEERPKSLYRRLRRSAAFTLRELGLRPEVEVQVQRPGITNYQAIVHAWK